MVFSTSIQSYSTSRLGVIGNVNTGTGGRTPNPHSACTAFTAFSSPSRRTTTPFTSTSLTPSASFCGSA